ncbi:MAG: calcium-binding protein, partial [Primorskyibacter sp.]
MSSDPVVPQIETDETPATSAAQSEDIQIVFGDQQDSVVTMDARYGIYASWHPDSVLEGSSGSDTVDGGGGTDELFYFYETGVLPTGSSTTRGIIANLTGAQISGKVFDDGDDDASNDQTFLLAPGEVLKAAGGTDTTSNFEAIHGSQHSDIIHINTGGFVADKGGDDSVVGGDLGTSFWAGDGNDTYLGGSGFDELIYGVSALGDADIGTQGIDLQLDGQGGGTTRDPWDEVDVFSGIDRFVGSSFGDRMVGDSGGDYFIGGAGNDTLRGEAGSDTLVGGDGNDVIDVGNSNHFDLILPGLGIDSISFTNVTATHASAAISHLDLNGGISFGIGGFDFATLVKPDGSETVFSSIQKIIAAGGLTIIGTQHDDEFDVKVADDGRMILQAAAGNDTIEIADHNGELRLDYRASGVDQGVDINLATRVVSNDGYGGVDQLLGTGRVTELRGTTFSDKITGSDASEIFILDAGTDTLDAGAGYDMLRYDFNGVGGVNANLNAGTVTGTWNDVAFAHGVSGIEEVRGGDGNDTLNAAGLSGEIQLVGGAGDDLITGGSGDNHLAALRGDNTISGGAGEDDLYIAETNNVLDGGADFDTAHLNDDSSGAVTV